MGGRNAPAAFGIYVHVPFCVTVCPYCDFNVYAGLEHTAGDYLDAVLAEARGWVERDGPFPVSGSVFVGGGTPTLVDAAVMARFLDRLRAVLAIDERAEVTIEANPETVTAASLRVLREAGVNRVSLGVQSFVPGVLAALGRAHSPEVADAAFGAARAAGFENVSVDLIFGAPNETLADWRQTLSRALALGPEHVSCYGLMIEEGTAFGYAVRSGRMQPPDDDLQAAKYEEACERIGLEHYEISNWGEPASAHNLVYWSQGDYLGLGAGAHSHRAGRRWWNHKRPALYQQHAGTDPVAGSETLTDRERDEEWLQLRLRLLAPLAIAEVAGRLRADPSGEIARLEQAGLVESRRDPGEPAFALTRAGRLLENEVCLALLGVAAHRPRSSLDLLPDG